MAGREREADGDCVDPDDCEDACFDEPGELDSDVGLCICDDVQSTSYWCNEECIAAAETITFAAKQFTITIQGTDNVYDYSESSELSVATGACENGCTIYEIDMDEDAPRCVFGAGQAFAIHGYRRLNEGKARLL